MMLFTLRRRVALAICPELKPRSWNPSDPNPLRLQRWVSPVAGADHAVNQVVEGGQSIGCDAAAAEPASREGGAAFESESVERLALDQRVGQGGEGDVEGREASVGRVGHSVPVLPVVGATEGKGVPGPDKGHFVPGRGALVALCEKLANHQGVTHFAISMRALGKGDFFKKLMAGGDCRTATASRVLGWFDENWASDLEWPRDIPRPQSSKKKEAA